MFMNYMDYTDDACMYMFTNGQKARMQAQFATGGIRNSLLTSNGCGAPPPPAACGTSAGLNATSVTSTSATLNWGPVSGATSYNVRVKAVSSATWTTTAVAGTSQGVSGLTAGTQYEFQAQALCSAGSGNFSASAFFTTLAAGCTDAYESNGTQSTAKTIPVNSSIQALISSSTDVDWYKFSNTSSQRKIKVTLSNLPLDYDVALYNSSGGRLRLSENGGTTTETMTYNTNTVGTYYIKVYGYNGAFSSSCYSLLAQISANSFRSTDEEAIDGASSGITSIYPNPATDFITVNYLSTTEKEVTYSMVDMTGRTLSLSKELLTEGVNTLKLNTAHLSPGIYMLRITDGETNEVKRFVIGE